LKWQGLVYETFQVIILTDKSVSYLHLFSRYVELEGSRKQENPPRSSSSAGLELSGELLAL
jgi:hypothetical protein